MLFAMVLWFAVWKAFIRVRTVCAQSQVHTKFNAYNRPTQETNAHTMYLSVSNILWQCVPLK